MKTPTWFDAEKTKQILEARKRVHNMRGDDLIEEYTHTKDEIFAHAAALEIRQRHLRMPRRSK